MDKSPKARIPFLVRAAILVSFFPCAILYPLHYPVREIATLLLWLIAFPSAVGYLSFLLLPVLPSASYGYFAFNLLCVLGTFGIAIQIARWATANGENVNRLHRFVRTCMLITFALAAWQAVDGKDWLNAFPDMYAIGAGRGGGLRTEPSLLAAPLAVYLVIVLSKRLHPSTDDAERKRLFLEAGAYALTTLLLTRSLSVAVVLLCFLPAYTRNLKYLIASGGAGALLAATVLWVRVRDALSDSATFAYLITSALGSWRNVPDLVILANARDFLFPSAPANLRDKLTLFTAIWNPAFAWLDNTYSTFSASASTLGLLATCSLLVLGLVFGLNNSSSKDHVRSTWIALYFTNWFILPKYEPCGWIGIGILTAVLRFCERPSSAITATSGSDSHVPLTEAWMKRRLS